MNTAAKRIHDKYHGNERKIKIPLPVLIAAMLALTILTSTLVAVNAAKKVVDIYASRSVDETAYVQETGKYPDWFLEWLNREYYLETQKLGGGNGTMQELD